MSSCPCCSHTMLRHIRSNEVYWFCRRCWQEMPNVEQLRSKSLLVNLSTTLGIGEKHPALVKI